MPSRRLRPSRGFLSLLLLCAPVLALAGWGPLADEIMFEDTMLFLERYGVIVAIGLFLIWVWIGTLDKDRFYSDGSRKRLY